jgi:hypothetical protein
MEKYFEVNQMEVKSRNKNNSFKIEFLKNTGLVFQQSLMIADKFIYKTILLI